MVRPGLGPGVGIKAGTAAPPRRRGVAPCPPTCEPELRRQCASALSGTRSLLRCAGDHCATPATPRQGSHRCRRPARERHAVPRPHGATAQPGRSSAARQTPPSVIARRAPRVDMGQQPVEQREAAAHAVVASGEHLEGQLEDHGRGVQSGAAKSSSRPTEPAACRPRRARRPRPQPAPPAVRHWRSAVTQACWRRAVPTAPCTASKGCT